eukprot:9544809-Heterocapsa_arctica.AAC.1
MAEEDDSQSAHHLRMGNLHLRMASELSRVTARRQPAEAAIPRRSTEVEAAGLPGSQHRQEPGAQVNADARPGPHPMSGSHTAPEADPRAPVQPDQAAGIRLPTSQMEPEEESPPNEQQVPAAPHEEMAGPEGACKSLRKAEAGAPAGKQASAQGPTTATS